MGEVPSSKPRIFRTLHCARAAAFRLLGGVERALTRALEVSRVGVTGVVGLTCFFDGRGGVEGVGVDVAVDFVRKPKPLVFLPAVDVVDADGGGGPFGLNGFLRDEPRDVAGFLRAVVEDENGEA